MHFRHRNHLWFNHECIRRQVLPESLQIKPPINNFEGKELARKFGFNCLRLRIRNSHRKRNACNHTSKRLVDFLEKSLCQSELKDLKELLSNQLKDYGCWLKNNHSKLINAIHNVRKSESDNPIKKKWVINLSDTTLTESQNQVLQLGLNFASVEKCLYKVTGAEATHIRSKVDSAFKTHSPEPCLLSPEECNALTKLRNYPDIVTLKADKGNVTVVMNRNDYDNQIFKMLHDQSKYQPLKCDTTKATEKTFNTFVSGLKQNKRISTRDEFALKSSDGRAPRLYGLPKIHKQGIPLRPIVLFVESPTYNLSKEIARILAHLVGKSERHVKNSYDFVEFLNTIKVGDNESMVSFDVVSLFNKIPIDLAMEIAIKKRLESYPSENLQEITNWSVEEICMGL